MERDRISGQLQENLLTLLAFDPENGRLIHRMVEPTTYEGEYQEIARRLAEYWRKYDKPPGLLLGDLFADIIEDPGNRRANWFKKALQNAHTLWTSGINARYCIDEVSNFKRAAQIKAAILESAEKINSKQQLAVADIENLWNRILRVKDITFDPGMSLDQYEEVLEYIALRQVEFTTGIPHLDKAKIVPYRGALMMLVGRAKGGKSWFLTQIGKQALVQRKRVVHVSLEMSAHQCVQRYYQALFSISKYQLKVELPRFQLDKLGNVTGIDFEEEDVETTFSNDLIADELRARLGEWTKRARNIRIKRFPPRGLTPDQLRGYLDNLEIVEGFIPDILILDYAGLLKTDPKNQRIELGRNVEEIRAIAVERNIAVVSAHQSNRQGAKSKMVRSTDVGEDWSVVQTADTVLTLSSTKYEKNHGLARIYVANARDEEDEWGMVISQAIIMGQFCLDSAKLSKTYTSIVDAFTAEEEGTEEEEDED